MAYDDSGALPISQSTYSLGGYTFELKVQTVHEPGEPDVVSVFAICRGPDGNRETQAVDFPSGTQFESWYVEANESEASVYIQPSLPKGGITPPINYTTGNTTGAHDTPSGEHQVMEYTIPSDVRSFCTQNGSILTLIRAADYPATFSYKGYAIDKDGKKGPEITGTSSLSSSITINGKTAYYIKSDTDVSNWLNITYNGPLNNGNANATDAWLSVYGNLVSDDSLIARFAIDIREADGGPDGGWDEPGDVGPDPEKHFTLTVSVTGASSGSNSGTPLEPEQAGGYGDGGTGGNGGGGGAGASTVIIYEFATNKADNVVQEATAQGPGSGGPGGKGGKGSDGCILIFY